MRAAQALGISLFAGEAEHGRLDQLICDAWNGVLRPLYNYMDDLPALEGEPPPILNRRVMLASAAAFWPLAVTRKNSDVS